MAIYVVTTSSTLFFLKIKSSGTEKKGKFVNLYISFLLNSELILITFLVRNTEREIIIKNLKDLFNFLMLSFPNDKKIDIGKQKSKKNIGYPPYLICGCFKNQKIKIVVVKKIKP